MMGLELHYTSICPGWKQTLYMMVVFQNPIGNSVVYVNHSQISLKVDIYICLEQTTLDTHTHHLLSTVFHGACTHVDTSSISMVCRSFNMRMVFYWAVSIWDGNVGLDCGTGPTELTESCACLSRHFEAPHSTTLQYTTSCT